jgi:hypothetical protein
MVREKVDGDILIKRIFPDPTWKREKTKKLETCLMAMAH